MRIVQVSVSLQVAPTPETLQQSGALISQGATNTSPNTASLLTELSDLTPLLTAAKPITSMAFSSNVVTVTTTSPHGFTSGDTLLITIAGVVAGTIPAGYNGTFLCTVTGASTFTYALAGSTPGSVTTQGVYTPADVAELVQMATTFFAQGANRAVYVLELGPGNANDGVTALTAYITANPNVNYTPGAAGYFYAYLVPREWDNNASFLTLIQSFESTSGKTYFFVTTTLSTYQFYTTLMKDVITTIEAPAYGAWAANVLSAISYTTGVVTATTTTAHGIAVGQWFQIAGCTPVGYNGWWQAQPGTTGSTIVYNSSVAIGAETVLGTLVASYYTSTGITSNEFSAASLFYNWINYDPSETNKVGPFAFKFLFGVTPFPVRGNNALLTTLQQNFTNVVGTGAEGGISNAMISWGTTEDGNDASFWYSIDWVQINADIFVANAVINGSNNPIAPLYYDQPGINTLSAVLAQLMADGVAFGMVLGAPTQLSLDGTTLANNVATGVYAGLTVVNAIPFALYTQQNPGDYKIGKYQGFSIIFVPKRGFVQIIISVVASQFPALA